MSKVLTEAIGGFRTPWLIHEDHQDRAVQAIAKAHEVLAKFPRPEKKPDGEWHGDGRLLLLRWRRRRRRILL